MNIKCLIFFASLSCAIMNHSQANELPKADPAEEAMFIQKIANELYEVEKPLRDKEGKPLRDDKGNYVFKSPITHKYDLEILKYTLQLSRLFAVSQPGAKLMSYEEALERLYQAAQTVEVPPAAKPLGVTAKAVLESRFNHPTEDLLKATRILLPIAVYCAENTIGLEELVHLCMPTNDSPSAIYNPLFVFVSGNL